MPKGFTLIELMVVTGIIVVISTVVLADNNRFGGVVQLDGLAYDIALSVRQAQVYGISVERYGTNTFTAGYGVHFSQSSPDTYVLFADALQANGMYDCTTPPTENTCEALNTYSISSGYRISGLYATKSIDASEQDLCNSQNAVANIDVVFERPEPDALISYGVAGAETSCLIDTNSCAQEACISLVSPRGDTKNVLLYGNGQISVPVK